MAEGTGWPLSDRDPRSGQRSASPTKIPLVRRMHLDHLVGRIVRKTASSTSGSQHGPGRPPTTSRRRSTANPNDGSYRYANLGWPGMINVLTAFNEHGVYITCTTARAWAGRRGLRRPGTEPRRPHRRPLVRDGVAGGAGAAPEREQGQLAVILTLADESSGAAECADHDNRVRLPDGDSAGVVNTSPPPRLGACARATLEPLDSRAFASMTHWPTPRLDRRLGGPRPHGHAVVDQDGKLIRKASATKPTKSMRTRRRTRWSPDSLNRQVVAEGSRTPEYLRPTGHRDLLGLWG